jgi:yeast amino acid transporter
MCVTYLRWRKACEVQGVSRDSLPYKSWAQPYAAWIGLVCSVIVTLGNGYYVFTNGGWVVADL